MSYPSILETIYQGSEHGLIALTVPHGAAADFFLTAFPEILEHSELCAVQPLFMSYLALERDVGAADLAHAMAHELLRRYDVSVLVVEVNYPRGIIDGGRKMDHCIRSCLPTALLSKLRADFEAIHRHTIAYMETLYARLKSEARGFLIDVHTMANFCPTDAMGQRATIPVSFPRLEDYVEQFLQASDRTYQRKIDLITSDAAGRELAAPQLRRAVAAALEEGGYPFAFNDPYVAEPAFLSHEHLSRVPALSIDVPKQLLCLPQTDGTEAPLDELSVDPDRVADLASCLSRGLESCFS